MFYEFAKNMTLEETREIVQQHNEALGVNAFIEADRGELVIFNYLISFNGSFLPFTGDPIQDHKAAIMRELRGIAFDKTTGKVVLRKLHKFWNCGQNEESDPVNIDWTRPHDLLVKEDGSMLVSYKNSLGEWEWHSKMGFTEMTGPVMEFVSDKHQFADIAEYCLANELTPVFEWTSLQQKIVLSYPKDDLVLLAVRHIDSGEYLPYLEMAALGERFGITVVKRIEGSVTDIQVYMAAVKAMTGVEGFVIRFDNGHMVKIKSDEYCMLHNSKEQLNLEKNAIAMILSDEIDDLLPQLDAGDRDALTAFSDAIHKGMATTARAVEVMRDHIIFEIGQVDDDRLRKKAYAARVIATANDRADDDPIRPFLKGLLFRGYEVSDLMPEIKKLVLAATGTQTRVDEVRTLFCNHYWKDYRGQFDGDA